MKEEPEKLKILSINEIELFKKILKLNIKGTMGGIETNHKNILNGLKARGHYILENRDFPKGKKPDVIISPTFGPVSVFKIWQYKKKYDCACVQHGHTTQEDLKGGFLPDAIIPYVGIYLRQLYKFSEIVITPSLFSRETLLKLKIGTKPPIIPVSNGVNLEKFQFSEKKRIEFRNYLKDKFEIEPNKKIISCVSVIWERKGVDVFHDIANEFPEHQFVWVGNYITAKKIKEKYDDLQNLIFTGFVDDVVSAYCGSDIFFFPSRTENQGIPLLEAAACKLPMLCRNLPTYDWLEHDKDCLKGKNNKEFKEYLNLLLNDKKKGEQLVENAYKSVQQHDINKILDQIESIYRRAIKIKAKLRVMGRH